MMTKNRIIGLALIMVAVWGGSYACYKLPEWAIYATCITACFVAAFGFSIGCKEEE